MSAKVEYKLIVDDKGRAVLKAHGDQSQKTGNKAARSAEKMERHYKQVEHAVKRMNTALVRTAAVGAAALLGAGYKLLKMAVSQEATFRRLQTAVETTGKSWEDAKGPVTEFLAEIQKTTRFGDTDMAPALQMITQLTGSLAKGMEGAKIAANLASSGLFDLNTASKYVAMAISGEVTMLGRYIPELKTTYGLIDQNMSATEKWTIAKDLLNKKFGGAAQKDLNSFAGLINQTKNYIGDIAERFGDVLALKIAPAIREWRDAVIEFIESGDLEVWAGNFTKEVTKAVKTIGKFYDKLVDMGKWISSNKDMLIDLAKNLGIGYIAVNLGLMVVNITKLLPLAPALAASIGGVAAASAFATIEIIRLVKAINDYKGALKDLDKAKQTAMDVTQMGEAFFTPEKIKELESKGFRVKVTIYGDGQKYFEVLKDGFSVVSNELINDAKKTGEIIGENLGNNTGDAFAEALKTKAESALSGLSDYKIIAKGSVSWETEMMGNLLFPEIDPNKFDIKTTLIEQIEDASVIIEENVNYWSGLVNDFGMIFENTMQATAQAVGLEFDNMWERSFGQGANVAERVANSMIKSFTRAIVTISAQVMADLGFRLLLSLIAGPAAMSAPFSSTIGVLLGIYHNGGPIKQMHTGGPVTRMHSGGMRPDERGIVAQAGEYMIPKRSVNADTYPAIQHIRAYGSAPNQGANVSIGRSSININSNRALNKSKMENFLYQKDSEIAEQMNEMIESGNFDATGRQGL